MSFHITQLLDSKTDFKTHHCVSTIERFFCPIYGNKYELKNHPASIMWIKYLNLILLKKNANAWIK